MSSDQAPARGWHRRLHVPGPGQGKDLEARTDLFSFGTVLYEWPQEPCLPERLQQPSSTVSSNRTPLRRYGESDSTTQAGRHHQASCWRRIATCATSAAELEAISAAQARQRSGSSRFRIRGRRVRVQTCPSQEPERGSSGSALVAAARQHKPASGVMVASYATDAAAARYIQLVFRRP